MLASICAAFAVSIYGMTGPRHQYAWLVFGFTTILILLKIRADLLVECASQKQIVIGNGGQTIKRIGIRSRHEVEKLTGSKVHLELWVKLEPKWARHPKRLKSLGYS